MADARTVELWKFVEGRERIDLERIAEHLAGMVSDIGPSCALARVDGYPSVLAVLQAMEREWEEERKAARVG